MAVGELRAPGGPAQRSLVIMISALSITALAVTLAGVVISPMLMDALYKGNGDYSVGANVGQAFGGASAVVACMTMFAVLTSVIIQHRQLKAIQRDKHEEFNDALVLLAIQNPRYRQCWGTRVAPDGVEEDLFYYCSNILKGWTRSWELRLIDERQAREYLRSFFESEVPRLFFERHGDWHRSGEIKPGRARFSDFANEEYLRAIKAGPPIRRYERYPDWQSAPAPHLTGLEAADEVVPLRSVERENNSR